MPIILHGPAYSTYARTARLALEEKGVGYELHEVDILSGAGQSPEHRARQPWGKVPAFEHDGFKLFETLAITRYVDEAFPGPRLQPEDARARARMMQICGIIDSYGYPAIIGKVYWQVAVVPMRGGTPDAAVLAEGAPQAEAALDVVSDLMGPEGGLLCGKTISLADIHLLPVIEYYAMTDPGRAALAARPRIAGWLARMGERPSVAKTRPSPG